MYQYLLRPQIIKELLGIAFGIPAYGISVLYRFISPHLIEKLSGSGIRIV
jgi:hypothetical protein